MHYTDPNLKDYKVTLIKNWTRVHSVRSGWRTNVPTRSLSAYDLLSQVKMIVTMVLSLKPRKGENNPRIFLN